MDGQVRHIIGYEVLQESERTLAFNLELTHVADIEESSVSTYRLVLFDNTRILYGHLPTAELDEACAQGAMLLIERGMFEWAAVVCCHG